MQFKILWFVLSWLFKRVKKARKDRRARDNRDRNSSDKNNEPKKGKKSKKSLSPVSQNPLLLFGLLSASGAGLAGLALFLYGTKVETRKYRLESMPVRLAGNVGSAHKQVKKSLRILHLSDLHLAGGKDDAEKVAFIQRISDDDFDLVILTGDVFEFGNGIKYGEKLLSRQPRLGAYAVFGNHDYYDYTMLNKTLGRVVRSMRHPPEKKDVSAHKAALEAGGFTVLVNETRYLEGEDIFIVGIDYPGIKEDHLMELMQGAPPNALKLGLFHLPRKLDMMARAGLNVAFGGHTHGGQVRVPGVGAIVTDSELARHEASGLVRRGNTTFHISRGLGADPRSNIRIFCPPAATELAVEFDSHGKSQDAPYSLVSGLGKGRALQA